MPDFNLRALIREVNAEDPATGPDEITVEVKRRISRKDLPAALDQSLRPFVVGVLGDARPQPRPPALLAEPVDDFGQEDRVGAAQINSGRSSKIRRVRETWRRYLTEAKYRVSDTPGDYRALGDWTAVEVKYVVAHLRRQADDHLATADYLEQFVALLTDHTVDHIGELPDAVLASVFTGSEAA